MTDLHGLSDDELLNKARQLAAFAAQDRQENQIRYYKPVSERARKIHYSDATYIGLGGGNRSSKTESALAEIISLATGMWNPDLDDAFRPKFRGPIQIRVVVESLTNTLHSAILPKLRYTHWSGVGEQGGSQGHWGWIPRSCLVKGEWKSSWQENMRTLTMLCRNPDDLDEVMGHSTIQFMSHDNDPSDFASGEFHIVLLDEPPRYGIFRENRMRILSVSGRMFLAMTWPR